jgi:hypothetical protein
MKRRSHGFATLILLIVGAAIALLASRLYDRLFAPWAFERAGQPALVGSWVGSLTTATGRQRGVHLEILLPEPGGEAGLVRDWENAPYGEFGGTGRMCDDGGQVRAFTIDGEPDNRRATHLHFHMSPVEKPAPEGLTPNWVKGVWDRANTLDLRVQLHWEKDGAAISGGDYPDTQGEAALNMTRGGDADFQAVCARLRRSVRIGSAPGAHTAAQRR